MLLFTSCQELYLEHIFFSRKISLAHRKKSKVISAYMSDKAMPHKILSQHIITENKMQLYVKI